MTAGPTFLLTMRPSGLALAQEPAHERLVDDGDGRRARAVGRVEVAPGDERGAVGREPAGRDGVDPGHASRWKPETSGPPWTSTALFQPMPLTGVSDGDGGLRDLRDRRHGLPRALEERRALGGRHRRFAARPIDVDDQHAVARRTRDRGGPGGRTCARRGRRRTPARGRARPGPRPAGFRVSARSPAECPGPALRRRRRGPTRAARRTPARCRRAAPCAQRHRAREARARASRSERSRGPGPAGVESWRTSRRLPHCANSEAERRAGHGEQQALGQQLARETAARRAQGQARAELVAARVRAREQQVGDVGAGDEQDEATTPITVRSGRS